MQVMYGDKPLKLASAVEVDISNELSNQATIIAQLNAAIDAKEAESGGGGSK